MKSFNTTRRDLARLAIAGSAALTACATPQPATGPRTYVLVHGAFHGGWCWSRVAQRLRSAGHTVFTPTQTGLGERRHLLSKQITMDVFVEDITNLIETEELRDVYLVGHSFGGGAVSGVADRMPTRLRRLVYLDAGVPAGGKSSFDRLPPEVRDARIKQAEETSGGLSIPVPSAISFGLTDADDLAWVSRRLTPHPLNTYSTAPTLKNPVGNGIPTTYIRCTAPMYRNVDSSAGFARTQAGWQYLEIKTGHDAMVSAPGELASMLLSLT